MSLELVRSVDGELEPVEVAKALIARAVAEDDATTLFELRNRASAYELYHRRAGAREVSNDAGEIKVGAERGLGQVDRKAAPYGGDRASSGSPELAPLAHVDKDIRAAWRLLGKLGDETFNDYVKRVRADENAAVSTAALVGIARLGGVLRGTTFECHTPAEYIDAAREVLDEIDLDPASSAEANETVRATTYYDADMDGLSQPWYGRVWLNPPYGRSLMTAFVTRCVDEYHAGNVTAAVLLLNAYGFDGAHFQPLWDGVLCFTDHRIYFDGGRPTFGSVFCYLGPERALFADVFAGYGAVVARWRAQEAP